MFLTIWLLLIVTVSITFYFHSKFLGQIKSGHPELYVQLGMPKVFTKFTYVPRLIIRDLSPNQSATKYSEFMSKGQWVSLSDPILNKHAHLRRISQYVGFILFILGLFNVGP